jgi:hypothetical protein
VSSRSTGLGRNWAVCTCWATIVASLSAPARESSYEENAKKMMKPSSTENPVASTPNTPDARSPSLK